MGVETRVVRLFRCVVVCLLLDRTSHVAFFQTGAAIKIGAFSPTCTEPLKFEKVIGGRSAASGGGKALGHETVQVNRRQGSIEAYDKS